jgi:adenylate cyclase class IV
MKGFKVRYNHHDAEKVLEKLEAEFMKEEILEDFYIRENKQGIWKLSKIGETIKIVHLANDGDGFATTHEAAIEGAPRRELGRFFNESEKVMRKMRRHYKWKEMEIVLDNIAGLGEFIELYPADEKTKQDIFALFGVQTGDLIKISYGALQKRE